jgi:hypothetical protein
MFARRVIISVMILTVVFSFAFQVSMFGLSVSSRSRVSGTVYASSGVPVSGAIVSAYGSEGYGYTATDGSGHYTISQGLKSGSYTVTAVMEGYLTTEIDSVMVTAGSETSGMSLYMNRSGGIYGRVTDSVTSYGIPDIAVTAVPSSGGGTYFGTGLTDVAGNYGIDMNLGTGTYNVTVLMPRGYVGNTRGQVSVTAGSKTTGIDLALQRSGVVSGRITTPGGQPLANVTVLASSPPSNLGFDHTNATGYYRITSGLGTGTYTVTAMSGININATYGVSVVVSQETHDINLQLDIAPSGIITGKVTDTNGKPVVNAEVSAKGDTTSSSGTASTDTDGHYMISEGLGTDTYTVTASAHGYQIQNQTGVSVVVNQVTSNIDFLLSPIPSSQSGKISGTVTGDPNPIPEFQYPVAMMLVTTLIGIAIAKLSSRKKQTSIGLTA